MRTGVSAPLTGRAELMIGRHEVAYRFDEMPSVHLQLDDVFPWRSDDDDREASSAHRTDPMEIATDTMGDRRHEATAFGPSVPWLAIAADVPDDTVLVPLAAWGDVVHGRAPHEGGFVSTHRLYGFFGNTVEVDALGGWPWSRDHRIVADRSGVALGVTCVERAPEPLHLNVKARFPKDLEALPDVALTLYGDVPDDLAGPDAAEGPRMWRSTPVPLPFLSELLPTGGVTLDPARVPRGGRAMFRAEGMRPLFFDVDELFESGTVLLEFEPGDGGVLLFAYQNHRAPRAHWGPGFGFDALRRPTSDEIQVATLDVLDSWVDPARSSPMGWIEHTSLSCGTFAAEQWQVSGGDENRVRSRRSVHPELAITLRDAAPGVVEVFVQD